MALNLDWISQWYRCLPNPDELTPLSQSLIPHELASAFNIPCSSSALSTCEDVSAPPDVFNMSQSAFESLLRISSVLTPSVESEQNSEAGKIDPQYQVLSDGARACRGMQNSTKQANDQNIDCNVQVSQTSEFLMSGAITSPAPCHHYRTALSQELTSGISGYTQSSYMDRLDCPGASHSKALQLDDPKGGGINLTGASTVGAAKHMQMKADRSEEADSGPSDAVQVHPAATITDEQSARTLKKPRLVWTSQLHKRFVDAVAQLGIKNAVPKTIMQLMNVDGLTRENVASHLQKYRLYLKRSQDTSTNEGLSSSDQLFASIPVPPSLTPSSHFLVQQHAHHLEHRFAPVQDRPMPSLPGSYANYFPPHISSSLTSAPNTNVKTASSSVTSIPNVNVGAAFSTVGRVPHSSMVIGNEHVRESCFQPSNSQPSHILTLFPSSGS